MKEVNKYLERITVNPEICHGKPCIRGMRWPIEVLLDMMLSEMTFDEILEDHPELEKQDLLACSLTLVQVSHLKRKYTKMVSQFHPLLLASLPRVSLA